MNIEMKRDMKEGKHGYVALRWDKDYLNSLPKYIKQYIRDETQYQQFKANEIPYLITNERYNEICRELTSAGIEINSRTVNIWDDIVPSEDYYPMRFSASYLYPAELEEYYSILMSEEKFEKNTGGSMVLKNYIDSIITISGHDARFWIGESTIMIHTNGDTSYIPILAGMKFDRGWGNVFVSWDKQ